MKFSDFIDVRDGTHSSPKSVSDGYYLVTTKNLKMNYIDFENTNLISKKDFDEINKRSLVERYDILLSMIGTVGNIYQERSKNINYAIKNVALLKFHGDKILSNWMNYYLQSYSGKNLIFSRLSGSTQQFISLSDLRNLDIQLPTRDEMIEKTKPLLRLDRKIMINNEINDNLFKLAKELFSSFAVTEYDILANLVDVRDGTHDSPKQVSRGYPLVTSKAIKGNSIDFSQTKLISKSDLEEINNRSKVETLDILVSMIGTVGIIYRVTEKKINFGIKNVGLIKADDNIYKSAVIYLYLLSSAGQEYIKSHLSGSTQQFISLTTLRNMPVPTLNNFSKTNLLKIIDLLNLIESNTKENITLGRIKKELLNKYF